MKPGLLLIISLLKLTITQAIEDAVSCEPMKSDICRFENNTLIYKSTGMPNFAGHKKQSDAENELATFYPIIESKCAQELQFFLCTVYVPMCDNSMQSQQKLIGPCRPLCHKVRQSCEAKVKDYGYDWPEALNCNKFPAYNGHGHMCIEIPRQGISMRMPASSLSSLHSNQFFMNKIKQTMGKDDNSQITINKDLQPMIDVFRTQMEPNKPFNSDCKTFKKSSGYTYIKKKGCIPKCNEDILFTKQEKSVIRKWILAVAAVSFTFSLLTMIAYIMNLCTRGGESHTSVYFANRSPLFLSLAFTGCAFGYLISQIGLLHNPEWLCIDYGLSDNNKPQILAPLEGHRSQPCIIVFLFVYFFGTSTSTWWTIVNFSWALANYKNLTKKTMDTIVKICHIFGWGIPALLTLVAIITHSFQADELISVCLPGALQDKDTLLYFTILPECLLFGIGFLAYLSAIFMGCKQTEDKTRLKVEDQALSQVKFRYLLYGVVYLLTKGGVLYYLNQEYLLRDTWLGMNDSLKPPKEDACTKVILYLIGGIFLPPLILNTQTKNTCFSLWNREKNLTDVPSTFPTVAYRPQPMEMTTFHDAAGLPHQRQNFTHQL